MRILARAVFAALLVFGGPAHAADKPVLNVYVYASFAGKYGPGQAIKQAFEAVCGCAIAYVAADDGGALLARLKLEGDATKADVVAGLDTALMGEALATGMIAPHGLALPALTMPAPWTSAEFVPFDWGYFAFVYDSDKLKSPPGSLAELASRRDVKILIQDPRTSTPGLGLLTWAKLAYGEKADGFWAALKPNVVTVTKGWSEAYGLFLKGEADMVLSYTTSPAYHLGVEKKRNFKAALFAEGHVLQIEAAGLTRVSKQPELAAKFLAFLLSPEAQAIIPEKNWMFPAAMPPQGLPASFAELESPAKTLAPDPAAITRERRAWIDEWLAAMAR